MNLRGTFDRSANAAYVHLGEIGPGGVARTVVCEDVPIQLDLDKNGHLVGIEVLNAMTMLSVEVTERAQQL